MNSYKRFDSLVVEKSAVLRSKYRVKKLPYNACIPGYWENVGFSLGLMRNERSSWCPGTMTGLSRASSVTPGKEYPGPDPALLTIALVHRILSLADHVQGTVGLDRGVGHRFSKVRNER